MCDLNGPTCSMIGGSKKKDNKKKEKKYQNGSGGIHDYISQFFNNSSNSKSNTISNKKINSNKSNTYKINEKIISEKEKIYEQGVKDGMQKAFQQMNSIQTMLLKQYNQSLLPIDIIIKQKK